MLAFVILNEKYIYDKKNIVGCLKEDAEQRLFLQLQRQFEMRNLFSQ